MKNIILKRKGFKVVELLVVLSVLAVVLVLAMPAIRRIKLNNNESVAIVNLHKLAAAFEAYRGLYGVYPAGLSQLRNTVPPLIDEDFAAGQKQGYTFRVSAESDVVPTYAFRIYADPTQPDITGIRYFKIGSSSLEANGVAYYALVTPGPWSPIGYETPGGGGALPCPDGSLPPCIESPPCAGQCCSSCSGTGCVTTIPPCPAQPPQGSCPYVYVWNGKEFVKDNDIIPAGNPHEYTDYYKLAKAPLLDKNGFMALKIVESLEEKSALDRLELIEVSHPAYVKIAPTPEGKIFTFREEKLRPALKAVDKQGKDVWRQVSTKAKGDYHGKSGDFITFDFGKIKASNNGLRLILSADLEAAYAVAGPGPGGDLEKSLHIEVLLEGKNWQEVSVVHPHEAWDIWAIDLTKYLNRIKDNLQLKITWTKEHKLDFCLLDTSSQVGFQANKLALISAFHNRKGNVLKQLSSSDNKYSRMVNGDEITLNFKGASVKTAKDMASSYIFASEGYYQRLPK